MAYRYVYSGGSPVKKIQIPNDYRVIAKKFVCQLAYRLRRLKKARTAFCCWRSRRGVGTGGGLSPPFGGEGYGVIFKNFNSIWCLMIQSGGSFMQKETTIKEEKLYMHRHIVIYHQSPGLQCVCHII